MLSSKPRGKWKCRQLIRGAFWKFKSQERCPSYLLQKLFHFCPTISWPSPFKESLNDHFLTWGPGQDTPRPYTRGEHGEHHSYLTQRLHDHLLTLGPGQDTPRPDTRSMVSITPISLRDFTTILLPEDPCRTLPVLIPVVSMVSITPISLRDFTTIY